MTSPEAPTGPRRSTRDRLVDVVCVLLVLLSVLGTYALTKADIAGTTAGTLAGGWSLRLDLGLGVLSAVAVWHRRRHPVGVALVVLPMGLLSVAAGAAAVIVLFTAAVHCRFAVAAALGGLRLVVNVVHYLVWTADQPLWAGLTGPLVEVMPVVVLGALVRARRQLVASLRDRAHRAQAEQQLRVAQARHLERTRIAREMHDVLGHRISLLSLHAGALEYAPDAPPDDVARAATVIQDSAHSAMEDLREVIGVLRTDPAEGGLPERPPPTLTDVPALVGESRAAGTRVDLTDHVTDPDQVADQVGRAAYRIVQEGLTNARKHAPGAAVTVELTGGPGAGLTVQVRNRPPQGRPTVTPPGSGTGLVGITERVTLTGGRVDFGTDASGGYGLTAWLPWPA